MCLEGTLAAARGEHERSRLLFEDTVDGFEQCGAPFEAAQARIELAGTLVALNRVDAAREEAAAALESLRRLGAAVEANRASAVLALADGRRGPLAVLTIREREVVGLLARGLTNREIALQLVVSEHTVHRHVTNILRKLDVPSRTGAAALAVRAGLLDDTRT